MKRVIFRSKVLFGLILMTGCGGGIKIEDEFMDYYNEFVTQAKERVPSEDLSLRSITIKFGSVTASEGYTEDETLGGCEIRSFREDGTIYWGDTIVVNKSAWSNLSNIQREILVFHELGHCLLERTHDDSSITKDGRRVSSTIMNTDILSETTYSRYREYYIYELFQN